MQYLSLWLWIGFAAIAGGLILYGMIRPVSRLYWRVVISAIPILLSAVIVTLAMVRYSAGQGGFKLGVDLVGGTILVYEIDPDRKLAEGYRPADLAASLKRRIDPNDLYNVTIRPVSDTRVEIILPTGGAKQAQKAQEAWNEVLRKVEERYKDKLGGDRLDVSRGQVNELSDLVNLKIEARQWVRLLAAVEEKYPKLKDNKDVKLADIRVGAKEQLIAAIVTATGEKREDVLATVDANYSPEKPEDVQVAVKSIAGSDQQRKDLTGEEVENIKAKIRQVGSLEFRILANQTDDRAVFEAATSYFGSPTNVAAFQEELERRARNGQPPPLPRPDDGGNDWSTTRDELGRCTYNWVELGKQERKSLGLSNDAEGSELWRVLAAAREKNQVHVNAVGQTLMFSRRCQNLKLSAKEREAKKYEYFFLVRDPEYNPENPRERLSVTGQDLVNATGGADERGNPAVHFTFNSQGGNRFANVTTKNRPIGNFQRYLAIILDDLIESAPSLREPITGGRGQITGSYKPKDVDALVAILRSGALPATLKPLPVSENTIGPTLGQDTIDSGLRAVGLAFIAVLVFMCIYYRFAGFVASVALLANLLLTIAFMVFVNATFTLPGLAGLVLTLGMAVDANVLIYERLREEREKGANLILALRNGYDRALPAIIDTHLTSIFTAIVLYTVGNDQLKGFGVSLASGLIISLFTSLFVTRTLFDLWVRQGWLTKLSMFRFFSKPNFNFMSIRQYMFTATAVLTVVGLAVFMLRGPKGLNIDFVGGTAFGGQLSEPLDAAELRRLLGDDQAKRLAVDKVVQTDDQGRQFSITYKDGQTQKVTFANAAAGETKEARESSVAERAVVLPDWAVEQIFLSSEPNTEGKSRYFNVRTTEKEPDLVLVTVNRLLRRDGQSLMKQVRLTEPKLTGRRAILEFTDFASPGFVKALLVREISAIGVTDAIFDVHGEGEQREGRFKQMSVDFGAPALADVSDAKLKQVLEMTKKEFEDRPQPERLENFDASLAADMQRKALYAIGASWLAILAFLWFRFGSWTFGLAAVLCLVHDLCLTLGVIAACHYFVEFAPGVAAFLKLSDFKLDFPGIAALLTLVGYSVNDTIVIFDRIREVRGKNLRLTEEMINNSINQTLSRTILASVTVWLVVAVLYWFGGEGVRLFSFIMVVGVIVGTYSSVYVASPLLLMFGEGNVDKKPGLPAPAAPAPTGA